MVLSITPTLFVPPSSSAFYGVKKPELRIIGVKLTKVCKNVKLRTTAISEVSEVADPTQVVATWQIIVGSLEKKDFGLSHLSSQIQCNLQCMNKANQSSLAGVTPFVVAGIEFSKRIVAQRNCEICKGSGLVLRDKKYYFRCPKCGGFLPWQSWKRFFSG